MSLILIKHNYGLCSAKSLVSHLLLIKQIAEVTQYLYLSAATAMTPSAMSNLSPSLVINVTKELPMLPMSSNATCIRLEVSDTETEEIFTHLYHVTTLIR